MLVNYNINFLESIKEGFKRMISWNKYRSRTTTQPKNNLNYLIDPTFKNINRLFALLFKTVIIFLQEILLVSITCH